MTTEALQVIDTGTGDARRLFVAPHNFHHWNPALRGAYMKGMRAALAGKERTPPYKDKRTLSGRLSWSRSFILAWLEGYDKVKAADANPIAIKEWLTNPNKATT